MQTITDKISVDELKKMSRKMYDNLVKAVIDVEHGIMVVDAEMHADEEKYLLEQGGSEQKNLWGINIYPDQAQDSWIEFDSMINMRPSQGNRSRSVEDETTRKKILKIVHNLIVP